MGLKDGLGKLTTRYGSQIGTFKNDKFVKDQQFIFEGIETGGYGQFLKQNIRQGAIGISDPNIRKSLVVNRSSVALRPPRFANLHVNLKKQMTLNNSDTGSNRENDETVSRVSGLSLKRPP